MSQNRHLLLDWTEQGRVQAADLPPALRLAGVTPATADWARFVDRLLLFAGGIFLAVGIMFFFAYNWQALGRLAKFGLVEACLIAAVFAAWRLGLERLTGKAALLIATLLLGALMALVGQTYQTGADTYQLFATWALLALPWVALARFGPLWLVWLALVNLAVVLYFQTFPDLFGMLIGSAELLWVLLGLNTAALVVWEFARMLGVGWLRSRREPRLLALASGATVTVLMLWHIIDSDEISSAITLIYAAWMGAGYAVYRHRLRDLFMLAVGVLSGIIVITAVTARAIAGSFDAGALLLIALLVIGLSAAGGWWLRRLAAEEPL
ncbi:MAG: DUF2157 domain-containing protein [Chromatiales bacterium]